MNSTQSTPERYINRTLFLTWCAAVAAGIWQVHALKNLVDGPYAAAADKRHQAAAALTRKRELADTARAMQAGKTLARAMASWKRSDFRATPAAWFADHFEMARNIMMEAGIEPFRGKLAVACITLNRVKSRRFPNTVKGVIWQSAQFSWTHLPKYRPYRGARAEAAILKTGAKFPSWKRAWADSKRAAAQVLTGAYRCDRFAGIYHYMNPDYVAASHRRQWRRGYEPAFRIGRHVFWKRRSPTARQASRTSTQR